MMKHKLLTPLVVTFMITGCASNNLGPAERNLYKDDVEMTTVSDFADTLGEGEYKDIVEYDDEWFFANSKEVNYKLAVVSSLTGGASYSNGTDNTGSKIENFLSSVGYSKIQKNYYYTYGIKLQDSIGTIIGQKQVKDEHGKEYTLLAVFPRNAGYADEWGGNFNIAADGTHTGFLLARDEMLRFTKKYITENEIKGSLKVWTAGYSRGAAATNLYAAYLADSGDYFGSNVSLNINDIYSYTIGTPASVSTSIKAKAFLSVTGSHAEGYFDTDVPAYTYAGEDVAINPTDAKYGYIHNFVASGDYVAKLPPSAWGFTRFGQTQDIVFGSEQMLAYLRELSPNTADSFANGRNYVTKEHTSQFNFDTLEIEESETMMSPEEVLDSHIAALTTLIANVGDGVNLGYIGALNSLVSSFGCDYESFLNGISSIETTELVKAGALAYLSYIFEKTEQTESEGVATFLMDVLELLGKTIENREEYDDQKFLADVCDLLFNDYQTDEAAKARIEKITALLPAPYGGLLLKLVEYAKSKQMTIKVFDNIFLLLASFYLDNKTDQDVLGVVEMLAGLVPENYVSMLGIFTGNTYDDETYPTTKDKAVAIVKDILYYSVNGHELFGVNADGYRNAILSAASLVLSSSPNIVALLLNGCTNDEGEEVTYDACSLSEFIDEVLTLALPSDETTGERKTLKELADEALAAILEQCKSEKNAKYVDDVIAHLDLVKEILFTLLLKQGNGHNLEDEINNALTFVDKIQFLAPSHYFELYVCYFKAQLV